MAGHTIYLSLGSNLGDREATIEQAISRLGDFGVKVIRRSSLYETEPVGLREQPWFLNCAIEATTGLPPAELLAAIQQIEKELGRERIIPSGPRTIDLDILLYDDLTLETPSLQIPHPRLAQRRFVLAPLAEIAPQLRDPASGLTIADLLARCADTSKVRRL